MTVARAHILVTGRVQGVCYRADCRETADGLGLAGWVRNLSDGRVELVAEGERAVVEQLIEWCRRGPPAAVVTGMDVQWEEARGEKHFRITR